MTFARVVRWAAYPTVMAASLAVAWSCRAAGLSFSLAVGAGACLAAMLALFFEWMIPFQREWQRDHGDVRTDLCYAVLAAPLASTANGFLVGWAAAVAAAASTRWGVHLWPASWPVAIRLALALVVAEFGAYWLHRALHLNPWLWRFHAVHHSVSRLYFLNGLRAHPLESFLNLSVVMIPLVLLGVDPTVMLLYAIFATAHQLMQHSNVDVRLGPLNWVLSMAEVHRWHHSFRRQEMDANYGGVLLLWDVVFGTRRVPSDRQVNPSDVAGIADAAEYPAGFFSQLLSPFRRDYWPSRNSTQAV